MSSEHQKVDSTKERVDRHRQALRNAGLRPVQLWLPDTRKAGFSEECKKQSQALYEDALEDDVLSWIESSSDGEGWS